MHASCERLRFIQLTDTFIITWLNLLTDLWQFLLMIHKTCIHKYILSIDFDCRMAPTFEQVKYNLDKVTMTRQYLHIVLCVTMTHQYLHIVLCVTMPIQLVSQLVM